MSDGIGVFLILVGWGLWVAINRWSKAGFPAINLQASSGSTSRRVPVAYRTDPAQQQAALEAYKHAVSEKMDVMRTAISMGWGDDELKRLDSRLEELIGKDELKRLIDGEIPTNIKSADGMDAQQEVSRLRGVPVQG